MVKNLVALYPRVLCQIELTSDELGHVAEEISKQMMEGMAQFLLAAYNKMLKERDRLRKNCQTERDQNLMI